MTYQRIEEASSLPPAGPLDSRAREKQDLDFKTFADKGAMWEHAKDIAAFANAVGGVLLVGADNQSSPRVLKYPGVRGQTVAEVMDIYQRAGTMCSPAQNVDTVPLKGPGDVDLVAVNVDPYVDQIVASPSGHRSIGWRFPIRRASQTDDIRPEDLSMFMNPKVRRAYLMLAEIPGNKRSQVNFCFPRINSPTTGVKTLVTWTLRLENIPKGRNFLVVAQDGATPCHIPLADVLDVWEESNESWTVKVSGTLDPSSVPVGPSTPRALIYRPIF